MAKEKILAVTFVSALFAIIIAMPTNPLDLGEMSDQFEAQVSSSASTASFTFSHNNNVLIAGIDSWTMSLVGGKRGDKLTVKAWKDDVPVNNGRDLSICSVGWVSSGCVKTGKPTTRDIGHWIEKIYVNGIEMGTINFEIRAQSAPPLENITYTFSHNNGKLVAGKDRWSMSVFGLQSGDSVYVEAWKNGVSMGKLRICQVRSSASPISSTSCGSNGSVTTKDIGQWEESIIIHRAGTDTLLASKGAIKFEVVSASSQTTQTVTGTLSCNAPNDLTSPFKTRVTLIGGRSGYNYNWFLPQGCSIADREVNDGAGGSGHWVYVSCGSGFFTINVSEAATNRTAQCSFNMGSQQDQATTASTASFTFSHNNNVLIAGIDSWTMSLVGGKRGDKLTVKAWKDDVPVNNGRDLSICSVGWVSSGCVKTGKPTTRDVGHWIEKVYVNGVEMGTISFEVVQVEE